MATMALVVLCGMVGLAVDAGWAYFRKQAAQSAAEAAALAAVKAAQMASVASGWCGAGIDCTGVPFTCPSAAGTGTNLQFGCYYAGLNGFSATGPQNVILTANAGSALTGNPASDPWVLNVNTGTHYYQVTNTTYWVTAKVVETIPQLFSAVLGNTVMATSARATAAIVPVAATNCGYLLGPPGTPGPTYDFSLTGPGSIDAPNCGLYLNADANLGGAGPNALNVAQFNVAGNCYPTCNNIVTGTLQTNTGATYPDPLASEPTPPNASGPCTYTQPMPPPESGNVTLTPGVYCGGININGNVNFASGTYVVAGGFTAASGSALTGSGVTFYNTSVGTNAIGPVNIATGVTATLSAPTTGALQGMLFYENNTLSSGSDVFSSSSLNFMGDIYFKNSNVSYYFYPGSEIMIVAAQLNVLGGKMTQPSLGTPGGPTVPAITLIE